MKGRTERINQLIMNRKGVVLEETDSGVERKRRRKGRGLSKRDKEKTKGSREGYRNR